MRSHAERGLLARLEAGEKLSLAIETYVREDQLRLFGFESEIERRWFRLLQSVQGVGAKSALAILGVLGPGDLANAIALQDKAMVARAPGVGPKVAGAYRQRTARQGSRPDGGGRDTALGRACRR